MTLVESVGKKAMFCQHIIRVLGLEGVEVIQARAEEVGQDPRHREKYDWAVARAVAKLNVLSEYLLPLVKVGGMMLAQKGESGPAEAQSAEYAMKILGGKLQQVSCRSTCRAWWRIAISCWWTRCCHAAEISAQGGHSG